MQERLFVTLNYIIVFSLILYLQVLIPRLSKRNVSLGVSLPYKEKKKAEIQKIESSFKKASLFWGLSGGILSIALTYYFFSQMLFVILQPFLYILLLFLVYVYYHQKLQEIKKREAWAEMIVPRKKNILVEDIRVPKVANFFIWSLFPLIIFLFNILLAIYIYPHLPPEIPTHWDFHGLADSFSPKSPINVFGLSILQFFLIIGFYISYYGLASSKPKFKSYNTILRQKRHKKFIEVWSNYFKFTLILTQLILSYISLANFGFIDELSYLLPILFVYTIGILLGSIYLALKYGRDGKNLKMDEKTVIQDALNFVEDDSWHFFSTIYYNKNDPDIFVEKRVGFGWTVNFARPIGFFFIFLPLLIIIYIILIICIYEL